MTGRATHRIGTALLLAGLCALAPPARAATITLVPGAGFSDATAVAPEGGNTGVTLGEQRTILFNAAAAVWASALTSTQTIKISAAFSALSCGPSSGTLGSAGATNYFALNDGSGDRFFAVALAEALTSSNINGASNEINANFNASIDLNDTNCLGNTRWYYGLTGPAPANTFALFPTVLHELGHGLGFATLLCTTNGGCTSTNPTTPRGGYFFGIPDIWAEFLRDNNIDGAGTNKLWLNMTDAERITSFTHDPFLVWDGPAVTANLGTFGQGGSALDEGLMRMYAPGTFQGGSSLSHFHEVAVPNLLMEPIADADVFNQTDLSDCLLSDIGWQNSRCSTTPNNAPVLEAAASPSLGAVSEDAGAPGGAVGALVSSLVDFASPAGGLDNVTDADAGALLGIAVTAASTTNGSWFYSTNGGTNWNALGAVSGSSSRLLAADASTRLYFQPNANFNGAIATAITFRAWDRTSGSNGSLQSTASNGGATSFSSATDTASLTVNAVNDAPVVNSTAPATATEDTLYTYNATRTDVDGPGQTWSLLGAHTCGGSIVAGTGVFTFTPTGPVPTANCVLAVQVCDGGSPDQCGTQSTTVTTTAVNDAPVINSSAATTATEDTLYTYNATRTDADGPGQAWTLAGAHTCGGSVVAGTGVYTFTPAGPVPSASCVLALQVCDTGSPNLCVTQSTTVTITAVNDAPVINSTASTTATEDTLYTYNATRSDADGPGQTWSLLGAHTCGGSIVAGTGVFTFTPAGPVPSASCVVAIQVCDGAPTSLCGTQSTTVTISAVNDAPVINSTAATTATEDVLYTYNASRTDADGPGQTWSLLGAHTCGGSIVAGTGVFTFTPAGPVPAASCVVAIQVCDGAPTSLCATQSTTVTISAVNDAPVINSTAATTATEDVLYTYNATRTDADGPGQAWSLLGTHTCGGSIVAGTGVFTFTALGPVPAASCVLAVQVCDGATPTLCDTQSTTVTITAVNDPPVFTSTASTTATEDTPYAYDANSTDGDGPGQSWSLAGTHTCGGSIDGGTGEFAFTPAGPVPPSSCVVAVTVCDGGSPNQCATQSTTVTIAAVNDAPVVSSSAATTATEDTLYTYNATRTDVDGPGQTWTLIGAHTCGGSIVAGTGVFTFTPAGPVPVGSCVVAVQVCDGGSPSLCGTQSTTVTITAVNDAPAISSAAATTATEDVPYTYNATRSDADGPGQSWSLLGTHACGGSIVAGTGVFTFTPSGPVPPSSCVVAVQVCDGGVPDLCATQSTTVTIAAANDAPVINSTAGTTATEDLPYTYNATRTDVDGPGQAWSLLGAHTCGGSIVAGTGVFTFTPAGPTPSTSCDVAIQVCDGGTPNLCATQSTTVTITPVNDAPVINSSAGTTATEDTLYTYNATRSDADGPGQAWTLLGSHTCGGAIVGGTGVFTFTPAGPTPPVSCVVAVQVCDGGTPDLCASQSTTVTISAANDAPVINSTAGTTATEDVQYTYNATRTDADGPGQAWSLPVAHTCGGSIVAGTGAFTFTPSGPVPPANCVVAVQVCDGGSPSLCATQSTTVTITAVNDAPVINSTAATTATEDVLYTYNATRSDPDGPGQTWSLTGAHTCGGSIVAGTGVFTFTPAGPTPPPSCVVAVQVCDGAPTSLCATQSTTVTITPFNATPVITSSAPTTATEDALYTYSATRTDSDGPGQTWTLPGAHTCGGAIVAGTGVFTFTPAGPTPSPSCVVAVRVCDGGSPDQCATQSTTVAITAVNDAPVINSSAGTSATEDTLYTYNATRLDADGPGQAWSLLGAHTCGGSVVAGTGVFTFTPAGPVPSASCTLALQVCDSGSPNLCATQSTTVTITAVNDAPVINSSAPATATEDTLYTYNATRTDADGPGQAWTLLGAHTCGGSIVAGTGVFTFTPAGPTPPASCVVAIQVCDGAAPSLCATQSTTVTISATNAAPVINSTAPATAIEDTLYTYNATRTDSDGPGQAWTLFGTHTCGGAIVAGTGVFTFTPAGPEPSVSCVVAIQVCDGGAPNQCATQSTTVAISAVNDAPAINSTASTSATEDTLYTYNATRLDADGPGQAWSLLPAHTCGGSVVAGTGVFTFTPAGPVPGASCVVAVQVCDGGAPNLCTPQSTTVSITATNDAPLITTTPPANATEASLYSYDADRTDPDGPAQSWTLAGTHTCGGAVVPATGVFTFTPTSPNPPASCVVSLQVCDNGVPDLCALQSATLTIAPLPKDALFADGFEDPPPPAPAPPAAPR